MKKILLLLITFVFFSNMALPKTTVISTIAPELAAAEQKYAVRMENVVNMQTPGYREIKSSTIILASGQRVTIYYRDFDQGPLVKSSAPMDFALEGEGFFTIQTPFGIGYTRDGRFILDSNGQLVTRANNYPVLGVEGALFLPLADITVTQAGNIYAQEQLIGKLRVAVIINVADLYSLNGVIFLESQAVGLQISPLENYNIRQGCFGNSNVNSIEQLGDMASDQSYQLKSKILQMELSRLTKISEMLK